MNIITSLLVALTLSSAAVPSNPAIAEFIESQNQEMVQEGLPEAITFEDNAIVMSLPTEIPAEAAFLIPKDEMKKSFIEEFKADPQGKKLIPELVKENVSIIMRLGVIGGDPVEIKILPSDF